MPALLGTPAASTQPHLHRARHSPLLPSRALVHAHGCGLWLLAGPAWGGQRQDCAVRAVRVWGDPDPRLVPRQLCGCSFASSAGCLAVWHSVGRDVAQGCESHLLLPALAASQLTFWVLGSG